MILAGIDAGGTSTKCLLLAEDGTQLSRTETGPANYQVVGLAAALREVKKAVELARKKAAGRVIDLIGVGMAGAGSVQDIDKIKGRLLSMKLARECYLTNDGEIAVIGAHAGQPGIVVIAGTGSIVYGLTDNFSAIRAGGWGPLLGDEGSGFWIGMQALKAIIKSQENRSNRTALLEKVIDALKITEVRGLVDFIHQEKLPRQEVAALAPMVIEEMEQGDPVAREIITGGMNELASTVKVIAEKISGVKTAVAATGGIFASKTVFDLFATILKRDYQLEVKKPIFNPLYGAVLYGAKKSAYKEFSRLFTFNS